MPRTEAQKVDIGIITIREDEFEAVLQRFPEAGRVSGQRQYNLRRVDLAGGGAYSVAVVRCIEQGNGEAQSAARDLLEDLDPRWLLVVGIAGGVPSTEFGLGDVIVSTRIHDFSVEAVLHEKGAEYALAGGPVDKSVASLAANLPAMKAELGPWSTAESIAVERPAMAPAEWARSGDRLYGDADWRGKVQQSLLSQLERTHPQVSAGAIASSDRLIKNTEFLKVWMKMVRQILAIEMESAGVYRATYGRHVPTLAIRGISDLVGLQRDPAWTRYACHTAAAFTLALLRTRPFEPLGARRRVLPEYMDESSRELGERIAEARGRKARLEALGVDTSTLAQEILGLRRQMREGGQLREGDSLGDGRYLLLRRVGRGGFATVWEAHDEQADQRVALKVLHSDLARDSTRRERFFRGARVMSELTHAAIVKVLETQKQDGGFFYFVMEFIPGGDLRTAVLNGKVSSDAVIPLVLQVGEALALAHERKFIHRDIKPANILLDERGAPRLTDFDLVGGFDTTGGTKTGALGTFLYAAPELMDRPQDADARADVYGLGMTALFGLYGREFSIDIIQDTEKRKLVSRLPCNDGVKKVIQRAVSRGHDKRYPNASKFCDALGKAYEVFKPKAAPNAPTANETSEIFRKAVASFLRRNNAPSDMQENAVKSKGGSYDRAPLLEHGAQLPPKAMMEAFGIHGAPKTGWYDGLLFLCISEKGFLLEPDRIGLFIGRPREDKAFVLTSHEPQRSWRYWGVAHWDVDENSWLLPQPVDHATWRHLGHGRSSSHRLPAAAEARARVWIESFLQLYPPGKVLSSGRKRCRILGQAPKGGIRIDGGDGGFKERTVSLTDFAWALLARDGARAPGEPLDVARVNRLRYLEGTPEGSTRFIDTEWALFLLAY